MGLRQVLVFDLVVGGIGDEVLKSYIKGECQNATIELRYGCCVKGKNVCLITNCFLIFEGVACQICDEGIYFRLGNVINYLGNSRAEDSLDVLDDGVVQGLPFDVDHKSVTISVDLLDLQVEAYTFFTLAGLKPQSGIHFQFRNLDS